VCMCVYVLVCIYRHDASIPLGEGASIPLGDAPSDASIPLGDAPSTPREGRGEGYRVYRVCVCVCVCASHELV
jgi:hypothetical protein